MLADRASALALLVAWARHGLHACIRGQAMTGRPVSQEGSAAEVAFSVVYHEGRGTVNGTWNPGRRGVATGDTLHSATLLLSLIETNACHLCTPVTAPCSPAISVLSQIRQAQGAWPTGLPSHPLESAAAKHG